MNEKEIIEKVSNNDCYCNTGHDRDDLIFCRHCVDRGMAKAIKLCNEASDSKAYVDGFNDGVNNSKESHNKEIEDLNKPKRVFLGYYSGCSLQKFHDCSKKYIEEEDYKLPCNKCKLGKKAFEYKCRICDERSQAISTKLRDFEQREKQMTEKIDKLIEKIKDMARKSYSDDVAPHVVIQELNRIVEMRDVPKEQKTLGGKP